MRRSELCRSRGLSFREGTRKEQIEFLVTVPLLTIDDLGMRKLPLTAANELLDIIMRRYERFSNRPAEDWGKLLGDAAAVSAILGRLLHHRYVLKCGLRVGAPTLTYLHMRRG